MRSPPSLVRISLLGEIPSCAAGSTVVLVSAVRCWCVRSARVIWCLVSLLSEVVIWPHPSAVTGAPLVGARQAVGRVLKAGLPLWPGRIPGVEPVSVPLDFVSVSKGRPKALHSVVPRGFLAGSNARRRLVAAFCACLCACAHCATSDKNDFDDAHPRFRRRPPSISTTPTLGFDDAHPRFRRRPPSISTTPTLDFGGTSTHPRRHRWTYS